jgi:hypothetical protein
MVSELAGVINPSCFRSHQTFFPIPIVKLLGIMFRNGCCPTTIHTITVGDADGLCWGLYIVLKLR